MNLSDRTKCRYWFAPQHGRNILVSESIELRGRGAQMKSLIAGIVVLVLTAGSFLYLLPRGGKRHRFVETELEPYVAVAICAGVALSFTMILSGILALAGAPPG